MAKVIGGLLSLEARGGFAKTLVFSTTGKVETAYKRPNYQKTAYSRTGFQSSWRDYAGTVMAVRKALSDTEYQAMKLKANGSKLSGHHLFMSQYLLLKPTDVGNTVLGLSELGDYVII
jgi:hypothetical protein